ncbi:mitotic spindle positioning protein meduse [Arctopsyche grandis]|uniref:mitotic spindle positioning protein meduse n=1 Tax=Arctopsyche grandis TaxID=121162 RepID=UPI00406D9C27
MRSAAMDETNARDDPLTRIQREIIEVTERENEFRKGHPTYTRKVSESDLELGQTLTNGHSNGLTNGSNTMIRALSTSQLTSSTKPVNGFSRKFTPNNTGQKGMMQRFIASRGRLNMPTLNTSISPPTKQSFIAPPTLNPIAVSKLPEGKLVRKGFVPVEEKIQKELKDLKDREQELKKLRKKSSSYQLDFSSLEDSDKEDDIESEEDIPLPGKLRVAKSIGELYEAFGDSYSPSPPNASGPDSYGSMKPAKSLAQLCELGPDEEGMAPSSTKLIAKWESLIQQKQESGAA